MTVRTRQPGPAAEVVVVGGGLAGLACALDCAERGMQVVLLESRPHVGGRASSWVEDGMPVESGLHRVLGQYVALPSLLRRAGVDLDSIVRWEDAIEIVQEGGRAATFGVSPLHDPLRTLRGVAGNNRLVSPAAKAALAAFFAAGLRDFVLRPRALDRRTVLDYARACRVPERAIRTVLVPLTAGIFFLPPERYSAYAFFGLLAPAAWRPHRVRLGAFTGPMTDALARPIARAIQSYGGIVRTGVGVDRIEMRAGAVRAVRAGDELVAARHVVLATSLAAAQRLIRRTRALAEHSWFQPMLALPSMPAVTLQVELDEPALPADRVTFAPETMLASFAEQSRTTFPDTQGRLSAILVPPEDILERDADDVFKAACADAESIGIDLAAHTLRHRVVSWPDDFYALTPGSERLRPSQRTPVPGLSLAGDYTRQPGLATMEGAVLSGHAAAHAVRAD